MNYLTNKDVKAIKDKELKKSAYKLLGFHRILQSVAHFDDVSNLDARAYFLTVTPKCIPLDEMRPQVYFEVNGAINNAVYGYGPERAGLVIDDDVSGTRDNSPFNDNPHFHGMIFLPKLEWGQRQDLLLDSMSITNALEKHQNIASVVCKKYSIGNAYFEGRKRDLSLTGMVGYGSKLVQMSDSKESEFSQYQSRVYPWDSDMKPNVRGKKKRLRRRREAQIRLNFDNLLKIFYSNPSALFTALYMQYFGEEINRLCGLFPLAPMQD